MTVQDRVEGYLIRSGGQSYCDSCLAATLNIPIALLEQATGALAEEGIVKRWTGPCVSCGETKLVSRRRLSSFAS